MEPAEEYRIMREAWRKRAREDALSSAGRREQAMAKARAAAEHLRRHYRAERSVFFRNVYGFSLSSLKLEPLLSMLPGTIEAFRRDLELFLEKMRHIAVQE